jgi:glycosyltransferase involved in cell wall biosynthesis
MQILKQMKGSRAYLWGVRVLYLTYDGLLDPLGQSQILPYLRALQQALPVHLSILSFEKPERWQTHGLSFQETLQAEGFRWYPQPFTASPPILSKAYDSWRFYHAAQRIITQEQPLLLHARSYVAGWVAHRLSKRYRLPWIFDMRGFWADERRETGAWPESHPFFRALYHLWKKREKVMLHTASAIIVLTEAAKSVLEAWGIPAEKITVIPCVADFAHFRPLPEKPLPLLEALELPTDAYILGYVGSIGPLYELTEMLRFFRVLLTYKPESYFLFFTPASPEPILAAATAEGLPAERFRVRFIPRSELPTWLALLDASIIFCRPGFSRIGSSPTRVAELLAMNIPVVVQADLGDNRALAETGTGLILCERFSTEAYEEACRTLLSLTREGPADFRSRSEAVLSLPVGVQRYVEVYTRLIPAMQRRPVSHSQSG